MWLRSISSVLPVSCNLPAKANKITQRQGSQSPHQPGWERQRDAGKSLQVDKAQSVINTPKADPLLFSSPRKRTLHPWGYPSPNVTHVSGELLSPHDQKRAQGSGLPSPAFPGSDWSLDKQLEAIQSEASRRVGEGELLFP